MELCFQEAIIKSYLINWIWGQRWQGNQSLDRRGYQKNYFIVGCGGPLTPACYLECHWMDHNGFFNKMGGFKLDPVLSMEVKVQNERS